MSLVGLISDSHGVVARTRQAVTILRDNGAEILIHLGDIESEAVLDELVVAGADGKALPVYVVFGNVDWNADALANHANAIGIQVHHPAGRIDLPDGKTIAFTHGHLDQFRTSALADGIDYFCHGHTHKQRNEKIGNTRLINPGALHRASRYTAALLNTQTDDLTFYPVDVR